MLVAIRDWNEGVLGSDNPPTRTGFCWIRRWRKYVTKDTRYDAAASIRCYRVLDGMGAEKDQ